MKKFGTPIWAGPGSERENVGVEADGTPAPVIPAPEVGLRALGLRAAGVRAGVVVVAGEWWLEGFSPFDRPGPGFVEDPVVVDEEELEDWLDEREVEVEVVVVLDDDEGEDVVEVDEDDEEFDALAGAQVSLSDATTPVTGSDMSEIGVPGGTLTLNVYVWPPTTVTVTVQVSASALGSPVKAIAIVSRHASAREVTTARRRVMAAGVGRR